MRGTALKIISGDSQGLYIPFFGGVILSIEFDLFKFVYNRSIKPAENSI